MSIYNINQAKSSQGSIVYLQQVSTLVSSNKLSRIDPRNNHPDHMKIPDLVHRICIISNKFL